MTPPKVLFVYYTHTEQAARVSDAMAEVLRERGCDVTQAGIEFTEPRYVERFSKMAGAALPKAEAAATA